MREAVIRLNRRQFLAASMAAAGLAEEKETPATQTPLNNGQVRLTGGLLQERFALNARRTFAIAPEDIAKPFLVAKGLPNTGKYLQSVDRIKNFTGWWPGLYEGFWMSGAAHIARWSGDPHHREILAALVPEIARSREADGFVMALGRKREQRWAHSDLYALVRVTVRCFLDLYEVTGDPLSLELARGQMDSMIRDIVGPPKTGQGIVLRGTDPKTAPTSYYKLLPALSQLYLHTGDEKYLRIAEACLDLPMMEDILGGKKDPLPGRHASTWVDYLMGVYQFGLMTGNQRYVEFVLRTIDRISGNHLFVTGSMSSHEEFRSGTDGWQLQEASHTEETCCAAIWVACLENVLRGTGDFKYADLIERAAYNAIFASQNPNTGDFCYFVNLTGNNKPYDPPPQWGRHCCEGNGLMAIGRLPGLIYGKTEGGLAVNLYAASEAKVTIGGASVQVTQDTAYPYSGDVAIRIDPDRPSRFALTYRIPSWSANPPVVTVNGEAVRSGAAIHREWKKGDEVRIRFAMPATSIDDDFNNIPRVALRRGPLLYAATWADDLPVRKGPSGETVLSSRSHYEEWPNVPTLHAGHHLNGAFRASGENKFVADGSTAFVPGSKSGRVALHYVPFLSAIEGKFSVWLPVNNESS